MKNARLWKRILNEGFIGISGIPTMYDDEGLREKIHNAIVVGPLIIAAVTSPPTKAIDWTSYNHIAMPFPSFWIEGIDAVQEIPGSVWGAQIVVVPTAPQRILAFAFAATSISAPVLIGSITKEITEQGDIVPGSCKIDQGTDPATEASRRQSVSTILADALDNLSLLSCKNVSLEAKPNDPKQVARAIKRHGGNADSYRYHVLVVRPAGAKSDAPAQEIGLMPRHVCRGHFAEYGPEFNKGLLFGKYSGRFFVPPHMKGDKKNGVVEKDYAIPAA